MVNLLSLQRSQSRSPDKVAMSNKRPNRRPPSLYQPELRAEQRVSVTCRGSLILGEVSAPCVIQNMCSRGFLIKSDKELPVGQVLRLRCELYPPESVECTVQVRRVNAECLGAKVIDIDDDGKILCRQFLEEQHRS
jgi:hypothetical protein